MADIDIRITGRAGRITFTRAHALNAMTYEMCMAIDAAMRDWAEHDDVDLVVIDAEGEKAFCAGGDIAELYDTGMRGDYGYGRTFWRNEYRLNAFLAEYSKPVVSFMQGFTMGGGVGIGCHGSHRVVGDSSKIAMPECGIGLVPDVGGSHVLANAPGRLGEYLGMTGARMGPGDAILVGFADLYLPEAKWPAQIAALEAGAGVAALTADAQPAPEAALRAQMADIEAHFSGETLQDIRDSLRAAEEDFAANALKALVRSCPISTACTLEMLARLRREPGGIRAALGLEYRFTWRAMEHGDFLEGIRAQIIDKDRNPNWQFHDLDVPGTKVTAMLEQLGADELTF
ncbi:MAG: enoyl-CoA hydratase/isomerase family protein [Marinibacterium sp.]|nr:enoyl-CoA hydratase/isomerase family protein [Marinibacterium sp.]